MKNKAMNALVEMGMPANIKGFCYIAEAMKMMEAGDTPQWGWVTALYWKLSEMHDDTPQRVERAIRHAFSIVLTRGSLETVEKYLTLQNTTNGNLLATFFFEIITGRIGEWRIKNKICRLLLPALQETRALNDLTALEYIPESGIVVATFFHKYHKEVNVDGDSGMAMIVDIVKRKLNNKKQEVRTVWIA